MTKTKFLKEIKEVDPKAYEAIQAMFKMNESLALGMFSFYKDYNFIKERTSSGVLRGLFHWGSTEQGWKYWSKIDRKLIEKSIPA